MTLKEKREALRHIEINPGGLNGLDDLVENSKNKAKFRVLLRRWLNGTIHKDICPHYILLVNLLYKNYFESEK